MEKENVRQAAEGLAEYSFDSFEDLQDFFVESWKEKRFMGMNTKVIGIKLYAWNKEDRGG